MFTWAQIYRSKKLQRKTKLSNPLSKETKNSHKERKVIATLWSMMTITLMKGSHLQLLRRLSCDPKQVICFTRFYHLIKSWFVWGNWSLQIFISQCTSAVKHPECPPIPDSIYIYDKTIYYNHIKMKTK